MRLLQFIALCTFLLPTACVTNPSPDEMKRLAEKNRWELAHWGGREVPYGDDGEPVILAFNDGKAVGHAGCNRYTTGISFRPHAGDITVSPGITTRMAREARHVEFEAAFIHAFEASARARHVKNWTSQQAGHYEIGA